MMTPAMEAWHRDAAGAYARHRTMAGRRGAESGMELGPGLGGQGNTIHELLVASRAAGTRRRIEILESDGDSDSSEGSEDEEEEEEEDASFAGRYTSREASARLSAAATATLELEVVLNAILLSLIHI